MAAPRPKAQSNSAAAGAAQAVPQSTLFADSSEGRQVVASFDSDADPIHIEAAKHRFIDKAHAEGRDANSIKFDLVPNADV